MKNTLSKLLSTLVLMPVLMSLGLASAYAATPLVPTFNNLAADREFLSGWNVTQNGPIGDPITAQAGDTVGVIMYYHNTVIDSTATNTTLKITLPSVESTTQIIKGSISADNAQTVTGTVVNGKETGMPDFAINSSALTKLEFVPGSVEWFPNRTIPGTDPASALPAHQTGDELITGNGVNIGDLKGCFQYSGQIYFKVKLTGKPVPKVNLQIVKEVRKAGSTDTFTKTVTTNPGGQVEFRISVRNVDGANPALNLRLTDMLPTGYFYVGPTTLRLSNGTTSNLPDTLTSANGLIVVPSLAPSDNLQVTFIASTDPASQNATCLTNQATATADNSVTPVSEKADTCFVVAPVVTPTPIVATPTPANPGPQPTPAPTPTIPKSGPELDLLISLGFSTTGLGVLRKKLLKNALKSSYRKINIL